MAVFTTIAFATFLLEYDHLFTFYQRGEYLAVYFGTFYGRRAYSYCAVGIQKEYFVEGHCIALLGLLAEVVDIKVFTLFSFELLSFDFYNSVHC